MVTLLRAHPGCRCQAIGAGQTAMPRPCMVGPHKDFPTPQKPPKAHLTRLGRGSSQARERPMEALPEDGGEPTQAQRCLSSRRSAWAGKYLPCGPSLAGECQKVRNPPLRECPPDPPTNQTTPRADKQCHGSCRTHTWNDPTMTSRPAGLGEGFTRWSPACPRTTEGVMLHP